MTYCPFSTYNNIFGAINTGVHSYRIFDTAIVDYILTILLSIITTGLTKVPIAVTTIIWLTISIILHTLFGVESNDVKWLGLTC